MGTSPFRKNANFFLERVAEFFKNGHLPVKLHSSDPPLPSNGKFILMPNMTELFETNRMSHFSPSYDDLSKRNLELKIGYFILR